MCLGDLVITQAAYRLENTSLQYVGEGYPAVAHPEILLSLVQAVEALGFCYHMGITATAPGFYGAQGRDMPGFPVRHPHILSELERQGIKNFEMETSCLLTLASLAGFRAGAVCAVYANRHKQTFITEKEKDAAERRCITASLRALHNLAGMDRSRGERPYWHPGLQENGC